MIRSAFAEFQVAISGLSVAQSNIQVATHNVSNAGVDGYSRQYAQQKASSPFSAGRVGMWGTGSEITAILQHRSPFLDTQYRNKNAVLGQYTSKNAQLSVTEITFSALGESGLTSQIDDIFNTLEDLSTNPESLTTRNNATNSLVALTEQIGTIGAQLVDQQISINQEIKTVVDNMNSIGKQVVTLNEQIKLQEANGSHANDLRDQRNRLLDELSNFANIKITETEKNKNYDPRDPSTGPSNIEMTVQINGYTFVKGNEVYELKCVPRDADTKVNEMDANGLYDIEFKNSGLKFNIYSPSLSGELKGLVDMRDGNNNSQTMAYDALLGESVLLGAEKPMPNPADYPGGTADAQYIKDMGIYADVDRSKYASDAAFLDAINRGIRGNNATRVLSSNNYKGLPHYMNKLNNFIRSFAVSMNEGKTFDTSSGYGKSAVKVDLDGTKGHLGAYDLKGNPGQLLFTYQNGGVYQYTGEIDDYTQINFANFHVNPNLVKDPSLFACAETPEAVPGDSTAVRGYISLKENTGIYKEGTYQDYLIALTGELAITKGQANSFELNYTEVVSQTNSQRMSVSGVDLNEEMVNYTVNQQLYQASAKLVTVLNSIYATCIDLGR